MRFKLGVLDSGYVLALAWRHAGRCGLVFRVRFPFPLTLHSWKYVLRNPK